MQLSPWVGVRSTRSLTGGWGAGPAGQPPMASPPGQPVPISPDWGETAGLHTCTNPCTGPLVFDKGLNNILFFLGMGCFWGAERKFWTLKGVYSTQVGYAGGYTSNPTYQEVCSGRKNLFQHMRRNKEGLIPAGR